MDAFPGLPLLRHKASFLSSVPQLPRGARGAWLGVEGRADGVQHPHAVSKMLGQGHEGRS